MKIMATNGKAANGSKSENLTIAFLANVDGDITLDSGKTIPKFKSGWKANDEAKQKARECWGKLKADEKAEITAYFAPTIEEFLGKKAAFKEFSTQSANLNRRIWGK